jgi:hypothetical protein
MKKNTFTLFLHHIFHRRPGDFLCLFAQFLRGFSESISQALPLGDLKKNLMLLGYSEEDINSEFQRWNAK